MRRLATGALLCLFSAITPFAFGQALTLRDISLKGTHNSYHKKPFVSVDESFDYGHPPLKKQLDLGIRGFEIDLHQNVFKRFSVFHLAVIDGRTHCFRFSSCLKQLSEWSSDNPDHLPILVTIEIKEGAGGKREVTDFKHMETPIRDIIGDRLVTPDDVQGDFSSLKEAVAEDGWPALDALRGKFLFFMIGQDAPRMRYTRGFNSLKGRAMFVVARGMEWSSPWAVATKIDNPMATTAILTAHQRNLLIFTNGCRRVDTESTCHLKLEAAIANGVHAIHDDFVQAKGDRNYKIEFPNGKHAICNRITSGLNNCELDL